MQDQLRAEALNRLRSAQLALRKLSNGATSEAQAQQIEAARIAIRHASELTGRIRVLTREEQREPAL